MPPRYQQGQLASPVTGTPGIDRSAGVVEQQIAQQADQMAASAAQGSMQTLQQAEQSFNSARTQFIRSGEIKKAEQNVILQEQLAAAKYGASVALKDLSNSVKSKWASDPQAGFESARYDAEQLVEGYVPANARDVDQAHYRRILAVEKAQFLEGLSDWQRQQEVVNSNARFQNTVATSTMAMQQANNTSDFLESRAKFLDFAKATALTPERQTKVLDVLKSSSLNFAQGIALTNPKEIEGAIEVSKQFLTNEEIGRIKNDASRTFKQQNEEILANERVQNEFKENVLEGKLTSIVKGTLQQANTASPSATDVSMLRSASREVNGLGAQFDEQIGRLERMIKAEPLNVSLIARHESLVKQKKQVESAASQLLDKADSSAEKIQRRNELQVRRQEAEAHRRAAESIGAAMRTSQAEVAAFRAQSELEMASLKDSKSADKLAEFSRAKLVEANTVRSELEKAKGELDRVPGDRSAAQKVKALSARLSMLAQAASHANNAAESIFNKNDAQLKQEAAAKAKLFKVAGVPLYTTLLQRAQTPFALRSEKGKLKLDGVTLKEATNRLNQLDDALVDINQSGMLTKEQWQTVKNAIEDRRQKLNAWTSQQGIWLDLGQTFASVNDAYNKPISDLEKKGLALPGTSMHHQTLEKYKANLDALQASIYKQHDNPRDAVSFITQNADAIAARAMRRTIGVDNEVR